MNQQDNKYGHERLNSQKNTPAIVLPNSVFGFSAWGYPLVACECFYYFICQFFVFSYFETTVNFDTPKDYEY